MASFRQLAVSQTSGRMRAAYSSVSCGFGVVDWLLQLERLGQVRLSSASVS